MKMSLALLALAISSLSLALQLRGQKPITTIDKYMVPARLNDFSVRIERAEIRMIRESIPMSRGVGVPFMRDITADRQHLLVRVLISEKDMPKDYEQRKETLLMTALLAQSAIAGEFDLEYSSAATLVVVQFVNIRDLGAGKPENPYAEYKGGELTFH